VVTNTIFAFFDTFGIIHVLTRGGPVEATHTAMYRVFAVGIEGNDLGKSAAQSLILLVIVSLVTLVQFRISERNVTYGAR
jgi:sn-glycerol 3-phosphate transport system permease protein